MHKSKIFLFLLLAFIAGVALRSFSALPYAVLWFISVLGFLAIALGLLRRKKDVLVYGFLALSFVFGIFRFDYMESFRPDLSRLYGKENVFSGYVFEDPERTAKVQRLKLKIDEVGGNRAEPPFFVLITAGRYPVYKIGDELTVEGVLDEPENFAEFDYVSYLARDNVFATMFFPHAVEKISEGQGSKLKLALSKIKYAFEENLDLALPEPHAAFIKGLTLGEREGLPQELVENFKQTGTTHIVALSGYNITLIGNFFVDALLLLTIPYRISFWIATSVIFLFVILTGASPSVVRAGIMGILVLIARREGRMYHMTNALAFAGAVMIFQNPKILRFDAAFELSFLATLGLVYLSPQVENWVEKIRYKLHFSRKTFSDTIPPKKETPERLKIFPFKRVFIESLAAQVAVLPLLIYLFGRVSIISPLTNILVLMAVPYSMALGFLTGFMGFFSEPLSQLTGAVNWVLLEYKIRVIEFFARFPSASVELGRWVIIPLLLFYLWSAFKIWKKSKTTQS